ncbi:hypothetical protein QP028_09395 [Corynebacterium suedekumii]|nr:hypothetical protein QP028_09395 [Corynebacterium suedekumii]
MAITVILSMAIFAAGYSMSQSSADRQSELDVLLTTTEPMSYSAHNLYTSLSLADTIATTGFVQGGVESAGTRARYHAAIDRAMMSATESSASVGFDDRPSLLLIADIERQIPIYTGLIETARTNNRVGNPVGVAYMAEASSLMREEILPAASQLFERTSSKVREQQRQLTRPQWVPLSGLFAAVLFLLIAQWALWRMTRRRLNKGFLVATALMVTAILWVGASNFTAWQAGTRGFEEASMPWDSLTASRIQAQQARTSETLALVRRQSVDDSTAFFESTTRGVTIALNDFENSEGHRPRRRRPQPGPHRRGPHRPAGMGVRPPTIHHRHAQRRLHRGRPPRHHDDRRARPTPHLRRLLRASRRRPLPPHRRRPFLHARLHQRRPRRDPARRRRRHGPVHPRHHRRVDRHAPPPAGVPVMRRRTVGLVTACALALEQLRHPRLQLRHRRPHPPARPARRPRLRPAPARRLHRRGPRPVRTP